MNRSELRQWLGKQVGMRDLPEPIWKFIEEDYHVSVIHALLDGDEGHEDRQDLLKITRGFLRIHEEMSTLEGISVPASKSRPGPAGWVAGAVHVEPDPLEVERAFALSTALAARASKRESVRRIRTELLRNQLVRSDDFKSFCFSPICRFASPREVCDWEIPLAQHRVAEWEYRRRGNGIDVRSFQGGGENVPKLPAKWFGRGDVARPRQRHDVVVKLSDPDRQMEVSRQGGAPIYVIELAIIDPGDFTHHTFKDWVETWDGSILNQLNTIAKDLTFHYPWTEGQALRFLVTGEVPNVNFVGASCYIPGPEASEHKVSLANLTVAPWVSAETVATLYRQLQLGYFGKRFRRLEARGVTLVRFVETKRLDSAVNGTGVPSWATLRREWNQKWPQWKYKDDNIIKDYHRAEAALLFPSSWGRNHKVLGDALPAGGIMLEVPVYDSWMVPDSWFIEPSTR